MIHEFTTEELKSIISGNFQYFMCVSCGGKGYWLGDSSTGIEATKDSDPDDVEREQCESCKGLGGNLHIGR